MAKCDYCGCDFEKEGFLCEASVYATWNEKNKRFEFSVRGKDFETKCPECYAYTDEQATLVQED
jgi:hypothetical protein